MYASDNSDDGNDVDIYDDEDDDDDDHVNGGATEVVLQCERDCDNGEYERVARRGGRWTKRKKSDERKEVSTRGKRRGGRGCMPMRISGRRV